jgi:hypothetical protein
LINKKYAKQYFSNNIFTISLFLGIMKKIFCIGGIFMVSSIEIDKEKVKEEYIEKNLFDLQKDLLRQRRIRMFVMSILLAALLVTVVYGTLENPLEYTLSNIGNFFDYRLFFIIWAIITGIAIQSSIVALFKLEEYVPKTKYLF